MNDGQRAHAPVAKVEMLIRKAAADVFEAFMNPGTTTTVEWIFTPRADTTTYVSITNCGFGGTGDEIVQQALNATEGFTFVLSGLKALLEHDIRLNLVQDRLPDGIEHH